MEHGAEGEGKSKAATPLQELSNALMKLLSDYDVNGKVGFKFVSVGVSEVEVDKECASAVKKIEADVAGFAGKLEAILLGAGASWNGAAYDTSKMKIPFGAAKMIGEDMSAIKNFAAKSKLDAGKSLTNIFRLIKTLMRTRA